LNCSQAAEIPTPPDEDECVYKFSEYLTEGEKAESFAKDIYWAFLYLYKRYNGNYPPAKTKYNKTFWEKLAKSLISSGIESPIAYVNYCFSVGQPKYPRMLYNYIDGYDNFVSSRLQYLRNKMNSEISSIHVSATNIKRQNPSFDDACAIKYAVIENYRNISPLISFLFLFEVDKTIVPSLEVIWEWRVDRDCYKKIFNKHIVDKMEEFVNATRWQDFIESCSS